MLTTTDQLILDFERGWWKYPEPKDRTIAEVLGIHASAYYGRLRELVDVPDARAYAPLTIGRLRRLIGRGS